MAKQPRDELGKRIDADPRVSPWGIRTADPYPQGIGIFFWYDTEAELREAIWDGSHSVDMDEEEWAEYVEPAKKVVNAIPVLAPNSIEALTAVTCSGFDVEWVGTFDELCSGASVIAKDARRDWLDPECLDDASFDAPPSIADDDLDGFVEFLRVWRI